MSLRNPPRVLCRYKLLSILLAGVALAPAAFGQLTRQANTSLHFPIEEDRSGSYLLTNALGGLAFHQPVAVLAAPGETNRLFVVERAGRIIAVTNLDNPAAAVFLDIRGRVNASSWAGNNIEDRRTEGLSGLAFHPGFATNGRFFVTYNTVLETPQGSGTHNRLAEFAARPDRATADPASEIPYITQFDEGAGHNLNDVHFGPDGYLYAPIGDEGDGGQGDDYNNAQKIDKDFFSGIIRIDVDNRAGNPPPNPHPASAGNYRVPADNPFVGADSFLGRPIDPAKVRTEFYAVGLRNPWRISFDPETGALYAGDVGQHDWEEIDRIVKGGNYGWSFKQGSIDGPKGPPPAGYDFIAPIWQYGPGYGPDWGYSVTGGVVYRGSRLPALYGHLIYADFVSGNIWAMDADRDPPPRPKRILGQTFIAGFGYDPRNGDVLLVDHGEPGQTNAGRVLRLTVAVSTANFPAKLSQTGIFSDLATLTPETGIYPFEVNLPFWSDGALKSRWFSLPGSESRFTFDAERNWGFPAGSVWIKQFDLEMKPGDRTSRRRVETRVLVRTGGRGYGLTYQWNDAGTEADLVGEDGKNQEFWITRNGVVSTQVWHFPSRHECMTCHTEAGGFALGFNTAQLNRTVTLGTAAANQIAQLAGAGFLANPPEGIHGLRALAAPDDASVSLTYRVKSYFAANCAYCHQPGGTAQVNAYWDGRIITPFSQAGILWGALYDSAVPDEKVVTPGRPDKSAVVRRVGALGRGRMPPIGSSVVDQKALELLTQWIVQETPLYEGYSQWAARVFDGSVERTNSVAAADADGDGANNYAEYLVGSDPLDRSVKLPVSLVVTNGEAAISFVHPANRALLIEVAPGGGQTNWTILQSAGNRMSFPAGPEPRTVTDGIGRPHQVYRARVIEP